MFKANAFTDEKVNTAVEAVLAGKLDDRAALSEGYKVDLAAAVAASAFAKPVLGDKDSVPATRRSATRTAILPARTEKV
ncbi:hypothetical protein [Methylorubrum extorquens]|uniref:hypothetical protein n=1 Tax=Methylorubrum extorquens TaxID=408 RepID=UPI001EE562F6|nr:hypothetical protein [Methylorubrum extorquens]MCG5245318.1 hypothetical protein [Methylorubrum extorquens]